MTDPTRRNVLRGAAVVGAAGGLAGTGVGAGCASAAPRPTPTRSSDPCDERAAEDDG